MSEDTIRPEAPDATPTVRAHGPDMMGRYWVRVSPAQVRQHPSGRPGAAIWLICAALLGKAVLMVMEFGSGAEPVIYAVLCVLVAFMLGIGAPWGRMLAISVLIFGLVVPLIPVLGLAGPGNIGAPSGLLDLGNLPVEIYLGLLVANLMMAFYLFDGERPNLIYAHRYRSYRAEEEQRDV